MKDLRTLKVAVNKTYGGLDFTYDGAYPTPRVKGKDKQRRSQYQRTIGKRDAQQEIRTILS